MYEYEVSLSIPAGVYSFIVGFVFSRLVGGGDGLDSVPRLKPSSPSEFLGNVTDGPLYDSFERSNIMNRSVRGTMLYMLCLAFMKLRLKYIY